VDIAEHQGFVPQIKARFPCESLLPPAVYPGRRILELVTLPRCDPLETGSNLRIEGRSLRIGVSLQPLQVRTHFRFSPAQTARHRLAG
jgi:hypothetical protein